MENYKKKKKPIYNEFKYLDIIYEMQNNKIKML